MINPQMISQLRNFMSNPGQMLNQMGIPQNLQNNPQAIIQHLMNTGRLSQDQYTQLQQQAKQIQSMLR